MPEEAKTSWELRVTAKHTKNKKQKAALHRAARDMRRRENGQRLLGPRAVKKALAAGATA